MAGTACTESLASAFDRDGFIVLRGALGAEELSRVQAAAARAEATWRANPARLGVRSAALDQVQAPIEYEPELRDLLWHPSTLPWVRQFVGNDVMMIDNDYFITPPRTPHSHASWHHDVGMPGIYHPRSLVMCKVFFLLSDVGEDSGGTAVVPGSHQFEMDHVFPRVADEREMPGAIQITGQAGDAYLFNCRIYHCAVNNRSDRTRRVLIYNYGHFWMKHWQGYEPSESLRAWARETGDPVKMQLLGIGDAYGQSLRNA